MLFGGSIVAAIGLLLAWNAERVGKAMRAADGGDLERRNVDLGGDARAYTFAARLGGLCLTVVGVLILATAIVRGALN